ncbi:hypothetical protein ANTPLA_LOCUS1946 [Anthophora plagiata]
MLDLMERTIQKMKVQSIVITMDANAKSTLWNSDTTDEKGKLIEEFALANNLYIMNKSDQPPTFTSASGTSNIDLTMTKGDADESVRLFNKILKACCDNAILKRRQCDHRGPWWNSELEKLRKEVNANKKQLSRAWMLNLTEQKETYGNTYKTSRNKYVKELRNAKKRTWQNFVTKEGKIKTPKA